MKILGISAFYHDSAASLVIDGKIISAAQEERFTRKKQDPSFPVNAIKYCLDNSDLTIDELDAIAFYDKPLLKFERLLETYYNFSPKGLPSFLKAIPVWIKEKMFLKKIIYDELKLIGSHDKKKTKLLFPEHHLSHAASAYYPSSFSDAAIVTIDGVGEWATASICKGENNSIKLIKELHFPHSLGLLYSAFTYFLGFRVNSGEYKLMGLAPYGVKDSEQVKGYIKLIKDELIDIYEDGSVWLNQKYFKYATGLRMVDEKKWEKLFGFKKRNSSDELEQHHSNLAMAIQEVTEEIMLLMVKHAKELTGSQNLCLAGGVALNCVANGKIVKTGEFDGLFIQPAAGDAGGAVGSALAAYHIYFEKERQEISKTDAMHGSYLGPSFTNEEAKKAVRKYKPDFVEYDDFSKLTDDVANILDQGYVVGWFQGRMEYGPRALGNRSIIGDARNLEMQKKLNLKIKYRESFRPFAPSVLEEDLSSFFELDVPSPYMLLVANVVKDRLENLPDNYFELPLMERLYKTRSDIQAVTHVDFSGRVQSVSKDTNERYWSLINRFKEKTDYGIIVNTSFNVRGEPIVCTPEDAYRCFMRTEMDYLVVNDLVFDKKKQPDWDKKDNWKEDFVLD